MILLQTSGPRWHEGQELSIRRLRREWDLTRRSGAALLVTPTKENPVKVKENITDCLTKCEHTFRS